MQEQTVLSSKGQVVIPATVRRDLQLEPGARLTIRWSKRSRQMILTAEERSSMRAVRLPPAGCLRDVFTTKAVDYVYELRREAERKYDD